MYATIRTRIPPVAFIAALMVGLTACSTSQGTIGARDDVGELGTMAVQTHEGLDAVLWAQSSVEYRASALQAYEAARIMLDRALADTTWTASLEQAEAGGFGALPLAVVLDVDETVLDNTVYQARLVLQDAEYERETFHAWVREERAPPVPGALAFTRYAQQRGVMVFYLTNRRHVVEEPTRQNLAWLGFPLDPAHDTILTRGEKPEWATSDKGGRRRSIAGKYRILLLVGDNLGDFVSGGRTTVAERDALVEPYASYWGTRWIIKSARTFSLDLQIHCRCQVLFPLRYQGFKRGFDLKAMTEAMRQESAGSR